MNKKNINIQEEVNKWDSIFSLLKKDLVASLENSKHNIN